MSYSNTTPNLGLPQILENDKPNWDIDMNEAFKKIDDFSGQVNHNQDEENIKFDQVNATLDDLEKRITEDDNAIAANSERITNLETDVDGLQSSTSKQAGDITEINSEIETIKNNVQNIDGDVTELEEKVNLNTDNINGIKNDLMPAGSRYLIGTRHPYLSNSGILPLEYMIAYSIDTNSDELVLSLTASTPFPNVSDSTWLFYFDDLRGNSVIKYHVESDFKYTWGKLLGLITEARPNWYSQFSLSSTYSSKSVIFELTYNGANNTDLDKSLCAMKTVTYFVDIIKRVYIDTPS